MNMPPYEPMHKIDAYKSILSNPHIDSMHEFRQTSWTVRLVSGLLSPPTWCIRHCCWGPFGSQTLLAGPGKRGVFENCCQNRSVPNNGFIWRLSMVTSDFIKLTKRISKLSAWISGYGGSEWSRGDDKGKKIIIVREFSLLICMKLHLNALLEFVLFKFLNLCL